MSSQAINSEKIRAGLIDILLGPGGLYEALKERGESLHNNRS
jgi:type I restriction enzyme R subunit